MQLMYKGPEVPWDAIYDTTVLDKPIARNDYSAIKKGISSVSLPKSTFLEIPNENGGKR